MKKRWRPYEIALAVAVAVSFLALSLLGDGLPCAIRSLVGLPCPSCGIGRALWSASRGAFADSFSWHPLWPLLPALALVYLLQRKGRFPFLTTLWQNRWFWVSLLVALMLCYLFRMILFYPHTPPLDPNPQAPLYPLLGFWGM